MSDESKEAAALTRLAALMADPHPGLATWRAAVGRAVDDAGITADAVAEEREACAVLAESADGAIENSDTAPGCLVAAAIRARGTVPR